MKKTKTIAVFLAFFAVVACSDEGLTDPRDGKKYKVVKIGTQTWIAENLNYEANGSKCYDNKPANCNKYGRLYNWETAKKACPSGWHLPSKEEWETLTATVGGKETAGKYLKAVSGWNDWDEDQLQIEGKQELPSNGEDKFGFTALPGGFGDGDEFNSVGNNGRWWSTTEYKAGFNFIYTLIMHSGREKAGFRDKDTKGRLCSVRCVQD